MCRRGVNPCHFTRSNAFRADVNLRRILGRLRCCDERALGPFSLRAGVASSALGIAQVCGSSLWIWLAAVLGLDALNMLIGILIGCSIVSIMLIITVAPNRSAPTHEEIPQQSRS